MEFKYRAVDDRPTPTPTQTSYPPPPPPPLPTITFFSDQPLRGGFSGMVPSPIPNTFRMPLNNGNAGEALRRELEKAQIRREIIAGEVARRLELEEEVRRELAMERGWGIAMQRDLGAAMQRNLVAAPPPLPPPPPPPRRFSFKERVAMLLDPGVSPYEGIFDVPKPQLPQLMAPVEIKPSEETNKDKVIILAKPNPDLRAAKRKAVTPLVDDGDQLPFGLKKKPKEEWSCALCQVSATSKRGLNEHLQGRRHKAKEAALRQQKIGKSTDTSSSSKKRKKSVKSTDAVITTTSGLDAKAYKQSLQPAITGGDRDQIAVDKGVVKPKNGEQLVQNSRNIEGLKDEYGTATATGHEAGRTNASKRKESKFWCEICQVGACSQAVMDGHMNGKKHLNRMKKLGRNNASSPLASFVSREAPLLIKDIDDVNKGTTDQKITDWGKFTVVEWLNQVENGDRVGEGL